MKLVDIVGARPQFIKVRPVELGWNVLVGCDRQRILDAVREMRLPSGSAVLYGDGQAAGRVVELVGKIQAVQEA